MVDYNVKVFLIIYHPSSYTSSTTLDTVTVTVTVTDTDTDTDIDTSRFPCLIHLFLSGYWFLGGHPYSSACV